MLKMLKNIFALHCPKCRGKLKNIFYDMEIDHNVYECEKCKKRFF